MEKKNKKPLIFISLLTFVAIVIGVTLAYFNTIDTFNNEFTAANYEIEVEEYFESPDNWTPGTTTPKEVIATNKSDIPAAVRVKLTPSWEDSEGNPLPLTDGTNTAAIINFSFDSDVNWVREGDWYYYNRPLDKDESTTTLIESVTFNPALSINSTTDCNDVNGVTTCRTTFNDYSGGKYTLRIDIETAQYNNYREIWGTNINITNPQRTEGTLVASTSTSSVFGKVINRNNFEKIVGLDIINIPSYAIDYWDCSVEHNRAVMCWYTDTDNNGKYELYIGQDGGVNVNPNGTMMFASYTSVKQMNLNALDTSNVTTMSNMFYHSSISVDNSEIYLSTWDFSSSTNFNSMFQYYGQDCGKVKFTVKNINADNTTADTYSMFRFIGYNAGDVEFNLENVSLNSVTSAARLFEFIGSDADNVIFNINNLSLPRATSLSNIFSSIASEARNRVINIVNLEAPLATTISDAFSTSSSNEKKMDLTLKDWDLPSITNTNYMFRNTAGTEVHILIDDVDMPNATDLSHMFENGLRSSQKATIEFKNFDTSNVVNSQSMFKNVGDNAQKVIFIGLDDLNFGSLENASSMFENMARYSGELSVGNLGKWNVSNVTTMEKMFYNTGQSASTFSIGNLSNWNTSNVQNMKEMFYYAGYSSTTPNNIGTLKVYASDITRMFYNTQSMNGVINIYSNPTEYGYALYGIATITGTNITVNYSSNTTNIDNILASHYGYSHVAKGSQLD